MTELREHAGSGVLVLEGRHPSKLAAVVRTQSLAAQKLENTRTSGGVAPLKIEQGSQAHRRYSLNIFGQSQSIRWRD